MNLFPGQEQRHRHREGTWGHEGGGEGEANWETRIDLLVYTLPGIKQIASRKLLHSIGSSARCSVMT